MYTITKSKYEEIKKCSLYKKYLGHNIHLCTLYGVAGNKNAPLWKRILSHVYVIAVIRVVDDKKCVNYLSEEKKRELQERIERGI